MFRRSLTLVLAFIIFAGSAAVARAQVGQDDLRLLGQIFRNRYGPYSQQADADPRVAEIAKMGRTGDPVERYKAQTKGLMIMLQGEWDEAREAATIMDMRIPAKLFEPGDTIDVKIFPTYDRGEPVKEHYMVHVKLLDADGKTIGEPAMMHYHELEADEIPIDIPADAAPGQYAVEYSIEQHDGPLEGAILTGTRGVFILEGLKKRLDDLGEKIAKIDAAKIGEKSTRHRIAVDTIHWHSDIYRKGTAEDVPGPYMGHPIFMVSIMTQAGMTLERLDFAHELTLAEELADALLAGDDPLETRTGDMRLAYTSPADGERVPFRVFIPEGFDRLKTYPLVMGLHGAGGDENAFMDRYAGLYKLNAQQRGYIAVTANGRGPYGGYRGDSGQDVIDVLDLVQAIYPIDIKRTYLTGHSMGGGGTVTLGFDHADRFAALAPIAGFGRGDQLEKAQNMPIIISQGEADALVPVASARAFYKRAQEIGMPSVKYIELEGIDHIAIVDLVLVDVFDWFDSHKKN